MPPFEAGLSMPNGQGDGPARLLLLQYYSSWSDDCRSRQLGFVRHSRSSCRCASSTSRGAALWHNVTA